MCYLYPASVWLCKVHFSIPLMTFTVGPGWQTLNSKGSKEKDKPTEQYMHKDTYKDTFHLDVKKTSGAT